MLKILIILITVSFVSVFANAQCKSFTKKKCVSELGDYVFNGQLNTAILARGEEAELMLSFYSKQSYRMFVCAEEQLEEVAFEILDRDRNIIYRSGDKGLVFDFKVPSTQQLIVHVIVPGEGTKHALDFQGCVSILIGFKED